MMRWASQTSAIRWIPWVLSSLRYWRHLPIFFAVNCATQLPNLYAVTRQPYLTWNPEIEVQ